VVVVDPRKIEVMTLWPTPQDVKSSRIVELMSYIQINNNYGNINSSLSHIWWVKICHGLITYIGYSKILLAICC